MESLGKALNYNEIRKDLLYQQGITSLRNSGFSCSRAFKGLKYIGRKYGDDSILILTGILR